MRNDDPVDVGLKSRKIRRMVIRKWMQCAINAACAFTALCVRTKWDKFRSEESSHVIILRWGEKGESDKF